MREGILIPDMQSGRADIRFPFVFFSFNALRPCLVSCQTGCFRQAEMRGSPSHFCQIMIDSARVTSSAWALQLFIRPTPVRRASTKKVPGKPLASTASRGLSLCFQPYGGLKGDHGWTICRAWAGTVSS